MVAVKGTKVRHYKVVEYRPRLRVWLAMGLLAVFVAGVQGAFWVGFQRGMAGQELAHKDLSAVRLELDAARASELKLRQDYEAARLGAEVDQQALESVRQELLEQKTQMAELEEENQFYRNLMAPSGNARGLNIGTLELSETETPRHFRFKIVMQQLATDHTVLKGTLNVNIVGRENGEIRVVPLSDLSKDVPSANIKLRYKYFQNIEGVLVLPDVFEPERIELVARSSGKKSTTVEKRFGWLVMAKESQ